MMETSSDMVNSGHMYNRAIVGVTAQSFLYMAHQDRKHASRNRLNMTDELLALQAELAKWKLKDSTKSKQIGQLTLQSVQLQSLLTQVSNDLDRFQKITASAPDPILMVSADVKIMYANKAWEELTGYTLAEVIGKNPRVLRSGKTPKEVYQKMWQHLSQGKPFVSEEIIDKRKDGSAYQVHSTIYPVKQQGKVSFYVQIQHDITERKQLDLLKAQFLAMAAHELKTPITAAKLYLQLLLERGKLDEPIVVTKNELLAIDSRIDRVTGLINDILDVTRLENGKLTLRLVDCAVTELVIETAIRMQLFAKDHRIKVHRSPNLVVKGDASRIEQVLVNLISNAIKHSPKGSTIWLALKKQGKNIVISVKDSGVGIAKAQQPFLFDRFYQVQTNTNEGFGLGLYIAKEIIDRHHGKIWVRSAPGKGSTFSFSLPSD